MSEDLQRFGKLIRDHRRAAGLTQATLADRVGLSRASIGNIESGIQDLPASRLRDVARALFVAPCALLEGDTGGEGWARDRMAALEAENTELRRRLDRIRDAIKDDLPVPTGQPRGDGT